MEGSPFDLNESEFATLVGAYKALLPAVGRAEAEEWLSHGVNTALANRIGLEAQKIVSTVLREAE